MATTTQDRGTRKVLVVEDHQDTLELLELLFGTEGHEVYSAPDGNIGLRLAAKYVPNVIFADIKMPELDGVSLGQRIRANSIFDNTVLVAYTGTASHVKNAEETGFDYYALKPLEAELLTETVYAPRQKKLILLSQRMVQVSRELINGSKVLGANDAEIRARSLRALERSQLVISDMLTQFGKRKR